ncbi:MAG: CvpA family protein [Porphyromonadaceae bacterium]|nr:CvpA family protein [Porphyromonadaceae bacterium]
MDSKINATREMNWIDLLLLILLLISVVKGAVMGAVKRIIQIAAAVVAFAECWRLSPWVRDVMMPVFNISGEAMGFLIPIISFALIFLAIWGVGSWLASFFKGGVLGFFNHVLGGVLGLVIGIYALGYLLTFADYILPSRERMAEHGVRDARSQSQLYDPIRRSITDLEGIEAYIRGGEGNK